MADPKATARDFLDDFYGDAISPEARMAIWTRHNSFHVWGGSTEEALKGMDSERDTYFTMAVFPARITSRRKENARAIFGVWLDVDCGDKGKGREYFPSDEEALAWVTDTLVDKWSTIVHSGTGLHVYLMFDEPFWIESEEDNRRAQRLVKGYHTFASALCPYKIDPLIDLARVMRVPGTLHTESGNRVHVVDTCDTEIAVSDLEDWLPKVQIADDNSQLAHLDGDVDTVQLKEKLAMLRETDKAFDMTWNRKRRFSDSSPSSYCMSIANQMVVAGFMDCEIAEAIRIWRDFQADAKPKPASWYQRTLDKARSMSMGEVLGEGISSVVNEGADVQVDKMSAIFGKKITKITKFITPEYKGHEEKSTYEIKFEDGRLMIPSIEVLLSQNMMKALYAEKCGRVLRTMKAPKWDDFMDVLMQNMGETEQPIEGNLAFNLESALKRYKSKKIEQHNVAKSIEEWNPSLLLEDERGYYFSWEGFKQHLSSSGSYPTNKDLAALLKMLGSESRQFSNTDRTRLWSMPEEEEYASSNTDL